MHNTLFSTKCWLIASTFFTSTWSSSLLSSSFPIIFPFLILTFLTYLCPQPLFLPYLLTVVLYFYGWFESSSLFRILSFLYYKVSASMGNLILYYYESAINMYCKTSIVLGKSILYSTECSLHQLSSHLQYYILSFSFFLFT